MKVEAAVLMVSVKEEVEEVLKKSVEVAEELGGCVQ